MISSILTQQNACTASRRSLTCATFEPLGLTAKTESLRTHHRRASSNRLICTKQRKRANFLSIYSADLDQYTGRIRSNSRLKLQCLQVEAIFVIQFAIWSAHGELCWSDENYFSVICQLERAQVIMVIARDRIGLLPSRCLQMFSDVFQLSVVPRTPGARSRCGISGTKLRYRSQPTICKSLGCKSFRSFR